MVTLVDFVARSYDADHMDLFWTLGDSPTRQGRYHVFVDKSIDGPAGPWTSLAGPFFNTGQLRDTEVSGFNFNRKTFYQLRITDMESGQTETFGPFEPGSSPDLIAQELRRRFVLLMQEHAGRRLVVFPVITQGFRCPSCFDQGPNGRTTGRRRTSNCIDCYDTTFLGGYMTPVAVHGQIDVPVKHEQPRDIGANQTQQTTARLPYFPPIKPGDLIVESSNVRWEVDQLRHTEFHGAATRWEPTLKRIPASDVRYKLPVNMDPQLEATPAREYTRPMSLQDGSDAQMGNLGSFLDSLTGSGT